MDVISREKIKNKKQKWLPQWSADAAAVELVQVTESVGVGNNGGLTV